MRACACVSFCVRKCVCVRKILNYQLFICCVDLSSQRDREMYRAIEVRVRERERAIEEVRVRERERERQTDKDKMREKKKITRII